ncbi:hypothetical protein Goari_026298 [Gossypium aridum]|uniref:Uncharacterized protein n=1 Tax=Gossypium aridum TaxID=34290 RepID=A0A7J8XBR1_GOSAI|nr:hypothetical protein [Gossypium aridum]
MPKIAFSKSNVAFDIRGLLYTILMGNLKVGSYEMR